MSSASPQPPVRAKQSAQRWKLFPRIEFRSRSSERDSETDRRRRQDVIDALQRQRASTVAELEGLTRRMNIAMASAASMLDAGADYGKRVVQDEQAISEFERSAAAARGRIKVLKEELDFFERLLAAADQ